MIKAKQRIDKLEKKTGGTKRSILAIAHMRRVTMIFDGETNKNMPEHKERIGLDIDDLRKSLAAYYEEEEGPGVTIINRSVPRPRDRTPAELKIIDIERIITDDARDLPGYQPPEKKPLEERTDEGPSLGVEGLSEDEKERKQGPDEGISPEEDQMIRRMTDEELDREIKRLEKLENETGKEGKKA